MAGTWVVTKTNGKPTPVQFTYSANEVQNILDNSPHRIRYEFTNTVTRDVVTQKGNIGRPAGTPQDFKGFDLRSLRKKANRGRSVSRRMRR